MATTTTIQLTLAWQSVGTGVKTLTAHGPNARYAIGASAPGATVVGHRLPTDQDVSLDAETDNVYVRVEDGGTCTLTHT